MGDCVDVLRDGGCDCVSWEIHAQVGKQFACVCGIGIVEDGGSLVRADSCRVYPWVPEGG